MAPLSPDQFLARIAKRKPVTGILLLGGDLYLRDLCRKELVQAYLPEETRDWAVARFSAGESPLARILQQAQTLPMLAPRQLIFVEELEALETLGDEAREGALKQLAAYLDDPAPFTTLVFVAGGLDQRMKLFKLLSEHTLVVETKVSTGTETAMTARLAEELGVEVDADAAGLLVDALNGTLARIRTELEKLALYVGERRRITAADVDVLVVAAKKYTVWQLAEQMAARQPERAFEYLDSLLREGEQPAALVGALAWMFRKLVEAQELPAQLSGWQAARQLGMRPETAELALRQARKIPRSQLLAGLQALSEADNRLKSSAADERAVMEFLLARLAGREGPAAPQLQ